MLGIWKIGLNFIVIAKNICKKIWRVRKKTGRIHKSHLSNFRNFLEFFFCSPVLFFYLVERFSYLRVARVFVNNENWNYFCIGWFCWAEKFHQICLQNVFSCGHVENIVEGPGYQKVSQKTFMNDTANSKRLLNYASIKLKERNLMEKDYNDYFKDWKQLGK